MTHHHELPRSHETKRLYFEDAYLTEFEAGVIDRFLVEGKPAVLLDQTVFYPESGGQPSDSGMIDGTNVLRVYEEGGRIFHVLDREISAARIRGVLDWERRFDHMQQHSGQHILSQCFVEVFDGETQSFHLGEEVSTLEIGIRAISDKDLERVEKRANAIVFEDREVKTYFVPDEKIGTVPLRRPPKKEGLIRVVEVRGFDYSACGGTHCRRTGEVGIIKIIKWEKIRNNLRFEFLCGGRALRDYAWKNRSLLSLGMKLSGHEKDIPAAVEKILDEVKQLKKKSRRLHEMLAGFEAREIIERAGRKIITEVWTDRTPEEAKLLALNVIKAGEFVVLYGIKGEERDHLVFSSSEKLPLDLREILPLVFSLVRGKGGGGQSLAEAVVERGADLRAVLDACAEFISKKLPHLTP